VDPTTILVVEDDPTLRSSLVYVLEEGGISAIGLSSADEALAFLLEEADNVAAVLTDVMMPGTTDGLQLARMVARQWPAIIVLVTSGRVRPVEDLPPNVQFLAKPWKPSQVVAALQKAAMAA
jgi:CheY-like chemotaxis protein